MPRSIHNSGRVILTGSQLPWLAPNPRMATESGTAPSENNGQLHCWSRGRAGADAIKGRPLTAKGRDTRRRIVDTAADLKVERGVSAVSLDEVGRVTSTSKSQMYHYFASKDDLVAAVVICVQDRILASPGDLLVAVESVEDLRGWADSVIAFHRRGPRWTGCPLGTLSSELMSVAEIGRLEVQEAFGSWKFLLTRTLARLQDSGKLRAAADPERLATTTLASLEGGLLMSKALQDETPLAIALDAALGHLGTFASTQ
jgi:TetR/AcrR family transcriptional repressor of nem operon